MLPPYHHKSPGCALSSRGQQLRRDPPLPRARIILINIITIITIIIIIITITKPTAATVWAVMPDDTAS